VGLDIRPKQGKRKALRTGASPGFGTTLAAGAEPKSSLVGVATPTVPGVLLVGRITACGWPLSMMVCGC
jgi:hypothetical protein